MKRLRELKKPVEAGDILIRSGRWSTEIVEVISVTKTGRINIKNEVYNSCGRKRGNSNFDSIWLYFGEKEDFDQIRKKSLCCFFKDSDWSRLSLSELEEMKKLYDKSI